MDTVERKKGTIKGRKAPVKGSGEAMLLISPTFEIRYANTAITNLTGFSPAELIGKQLSELIPDRKSDRGNTKTPLTPIG